MIYAALFTKICYCKTISRPFITTGTQNNSLHLEFTRKLIHSRRPHILSWSRFYASQVNVISRCQVCWVWWPTWCSPQPSSWLSAWAQRTGNPKHGTTAGPTCEFTDSCCTRVHVVTYTRYTTWVYPGVFTEPWVLCVSRVISGYGTGGRKALIKATSKAQVTTLKELKALKVWENSAYCQMESDKEEVNLC